MSIRITTAAAFNSGLANLQSRQQSMSEAQVQLTSGKRVLRPSDDPSAAARAERALVSISRADADLRAMETSLNVMTLTESALGDGAELLQEARETMVAAGNAAYSPSERSALAVQLEGIRSQLVAVANRRDDAGGYLFFPEWVGNEGPIANGPPAVYRGVPDKAQVERMTAGAEPLPLNVDGMAAWRIDPGTGESLVIKGLDDSIALLRSNDVPLPAAADIAASGITDVDISLDTLQNLRARVGKLMNRAELVGGRIADARLYAQTERSNAEDLDMVLAVSEFQNRQTSYDAALKTYSTVQRMSLFDYLGT
jgi:flagellar hook-associated protein 3 FlgL